MAYYDSMLVYAHAMHEMLEVDQKNMTTAQMDCKQIPAQPWVDGPMVYDYLRKVSKLPKTVILLMAVKYE